MSSCCWPTLYLMVLGPRLSLLFFTYSLRYCFFVFIQRCSCSCNKRTDVFFLPPSFQCFCFHVLQKCSYFLVSCCNFHLFSCSLVRKGYVLLFPKTPRGPQYSTIFHIQPDDLETSRQQACHERSGNTERFIRRFWSRRSTLISVNLFFSFITISFCKKKYIYTYIYIYLFRGLKIQLLS